MVKKAGLDTRPVKSSRPERSETETKTETTWYRDRDQDRDQEKTGLETYNTGIYRYVLLFNTFFVHVQMARMFTACSWTESKIHWK